MIDRAADKIEIGKLNIKFYGGVREIGGNIICIEYDDSRIILDIGLSFSKYKAFYEWPTRKHKGIEEMIKLGVAPDINGLFTRWKDPYTWIDTETNIMGILVSHAHLDHIGLLSQINRMIPVYVGETTGLIEDIRREIGRHNPYESYEGIVTKKFRTGSTIKLDPFIIKPIHVDHSIPGAYAFLIETPEGNIIYTGDYRLHGEIYGKRSLTEDMIEEGEKKDIELLITEGTRFHDSSLNSELDVYKSMKKIFASHKGMILINFSLLDIDRFKSFEKALTESGKIAVLSDRHFLYIWNLIKKDHVLSRKLSMSKDLFLIMKTVGKISGWRRKYYEKWLNEEYKIIDNIDVNREDMVLSDFTDYISNIEKISLKNPSIAIFSNSEPFNEEGRISQEKIFNWLSALHTPSYRIHSSGHIHPLDLKKTVDRINPTKLYVIHSEKPDALLHFLGYDPVSKEKK